MKFIDFFGFSFLFFRYFSDFKSLKITKKVFYVVDPCELTWHDGDTWRHHGSRHKPMHAHVGAYMARQISQAQCIGPTDIVGPIGRIREGILRPNRRRKGL